MVLRCSAPQPGSLGVFDGVRRTARSLSEKCANIVPFAQRFRSFTRWYGLAAVALGDPGFLTEIGAIAVMTPSRRTAFGVPSGTGPPRKRTSRGPSAKPHSRTPFATRRKPQTTGRDLFDRRRELMNTWAKFATPSMRLTLRMSRAPSLFSVQQRVGSFSRVGPRYPVFRSSSRTIRRIVSASRRFPARPRWSRSASLIIVW
jgi:hypothetical protein